MVNNLLIEQFSIEIPSISPFFHFRSFLILLLHLTNNVKDTDGDDVNGHNDDDVDDDGVDDDVVDDVDDDGGSLGI